MGGSSGGDDGNSEYWNKLNYELGVKSLNLQKEGLELQKQSNVNAEKGLELQSASLDLSKEANAMQGESLEVARESLAVSKEQVELSKQSQKLQRAHLTEPEKKVDLAKNAADATVRAQQLRSGLGSTFSRASFGTGKTAASSSATSGGSSKLGG